MCPKLVNMTGPSVPGCHPLVPWPLVQPKVNDPGGSSSWGVSQLAKHACVWHFNGTNGQNSAALVPSSHGGEPRTEGEMGTKVGFIACVYHSCFLTGCILGKGLSCSTGGLEVDRHSPPSCPTSGIPVCRCT